MTEEKQPSIEELQQQIVELREAREKADAELKALQEQRQKDEADLKAARDLNARLISKVPGEEQHPEEKDPYEGMTPDQQLEAMMVELVDKVAAEKLQKQKEQ